MSSNHADSEATVHSVIQAMLGMQRASWEQGTAAQALLEWGQRDGQFDIRKNISLISMCHDGVVRQEGGTGRLSAVLNCGDNGCLDPASLVEPLLVVSKAINDMGFERAARRQVDYLTYKDSSALRTAKGVLSHRIDKVQLWSDGIYMGPPALAFAGVHWHDRQLILEAVNQIRGYREVLWNNYDKLFSHIWDDASQTFERAAYWGVGNGWAMAGMTRVLLLLPEDMKVERAELLGWIKECSDGVLRHQRPDRLFHDVLDDASTFVETNLAQQVAYTIFRLAQHSLIDKQYVTRAEEIRAAVFGKVDEYGLVRGVCGSPTFNSAGTATEGQAFFILMEAAYRDCKQSIL